jgi:hypothetical protein
MAMTKAEQKAASDRIMAKSGPLTEEEQIIYRSLSKDPRDYPVSAAKTHICASCGAKFEEIPETKERARITALEQFSDHVAVHNPSPAQWTEAYRKIEEGRERAKKACRP